MHANAFQMLLVEMHSESIWNVLRMVQLWDAENAFWMYFPMYFKIICGMHFHCITYVFSHALIMLCGIHLHLYYGMHSEMLQGSNDRTQQNLINGNLMLRFKKKKAHFRELSSLIIIIIDEIRSCMRLSLLNFYSPLLKWLQSPLRFQSKPDRVDAQGNFAVYHSFCGTWKIFQGSRCNRNKYCH